MAERPSGHRHLPLHGRRGLDAAAEAAARRLRQRCWPSTSASCATRSPRTAARRSTRRATPSSTSSHERATRRPRPPTGSAHSQRTTGPRMPSCASAWGCTRASPSSPTRAATTGWASTGPRASWPRATAGRSSRRRPPRPSSHDDELPRHHAARSRRAQAQGPRASRADLRAPGRRACKQDFRAA